MPETSQVNSLNPVLQKINHEKEHEHSSADLENTKLYVLDDGDGKIKFICIRFDEKKTKDFYANKYDFNEFLDKKRKGKVFFLAVGVRENKVNDILDEAKKLLEISISLSNNVKNDMDAYKREKISGLISHFKKTYTSNLKEYNSFQELHQSYDRQTGENISYKLNILLNEKFSPLYKIYQEKEEKYGTQNVISLKEILDEGEKEYKAAIEKHQHYSTNTFEPLEEKFKDITDKFNNEIVQLENKNHTEKRKKRLDDLIHKVEKIKQDCENTCHENGLYSKKVIKDHNIIKLNISVLLSNLNEINSKSLAEEEINGLEKKYIENVGDLQNLKKSINDLTSDKTNQDNEEDLTSSVKPLFDELNKLSDEIKIYTPSKGKEKIKENLEKEINKVMDQQCNSSEDLINAINKANKFIKDNINEASFYTGGAVGKLFGKGQSILGELMHKLQELFGKFLELFPNHNSNVSSMSSIRH